MLNAQYETVEKSQERQAIQVAIPRYLANPANSIKVIPFAVSGLQLVVKNYTIEEEEY